MKIIQKQNKKLICPKCKNDDLKIVDYGVSTDKSLWDFYFVVICKNCKLKYKYYSDL